MSSLTNYNSSHLCDYVVEIISWTLIGSPVVKKLKKLMTLIFPESISSQNPANRGGEVCSPLSSTNDW